MLVRYRMLSSITNANFIADIVGILDGTITSTAGLSAGADAANSVFTGTYPSAKIAKVNTSDSTITFSKIHGTDASVTHYFRLTFDAGVGLAAKLTTFTIAQGYTSGTNTLLNAVANTVNVSPNPFMASAQFPTGINIVINDNCVWISSITSSISFGLFDLGANGITTTYAQNMKMAYINTRTGDYSIPYAYALAGSASGYIPITGTVEWSRVPMLSSNISGTAIIIENPVFITNVNQGYAAYGVNNLFKIGNNIFAVDSIYNAAGVRRVASAYNLAIVTE